MPVFVYRCRNCQYSSPVPATVARDSAPPSGRCERCGGPVELAREKLRHLPDENQPRSIADRLRVRTFWLMMAETWYAWRTSRSMLEWYRRVRSEEPGLTGRTLYAQVIMRRSGLDIRAASDILRQAEESFCSWPAGHDLRYRDVVRYVVVSEFLRSHEASMGTQTRMVTIVTHVIPEDLERGAPS